MPAVVSTHRNVFCLHNQRVASSSRHGQQTTSAQDSSVSAVQTTVAQLPLLVWEKVALCLDPFSLQQLKLVDRRCWLLVHATMSRLTLPVCQLKAESKKQEELADRFPTASCVVITPPERPVSLSRLDVRRRCEEHLAVFLDNAGPWPTLVALDICQALSYVSLSTLQVLADSLPHLQHLALPPCPVGCSAVLGVLERLHQLRSCDLDCRMFRDSGNQQQQCHLGPQQQPDPAQSTQQPVQQQQVQLPLQILATAKSEDGLVAEASQLSRASASNSNTDGTSTRRDGAWSSLADLQQLQHLQLQHIRPGSLTALLAALRGMHGLMSLSMVGLDHQAAAMLLEAPRCSSPASGGPAVHATSSSQANGTVGSCTLSSLHGLDQLTRLELGLDVCSSSSSPSRQGQAAPRLLVAPHTVSAATPGRTLAFPGSPRCCWSCLTQLKALALGGICLDTHSLVSTAACTQLTLLQVGGFDLEQHVSSVAGSTPGFLGLSSLRVLQVTQQFKMGPNTLEVLFPRLDDLSITDASCSCPDLRCLQHHSSLVRLNIEAAGPYWGLTMLQLGYLLHLPKLTDLRLSGSKNSGYGSSMLRSTRPSCSSSSSSHWLPSCTASLTQVTSLELSGPANDHSMGQLAGQFPGLKRLTIDHSYFISDNGLRKLICLAELRALVLRGCSHITEYGLEVLLRGGGIAVTAVQGCAGVDERACQRIRKACRHTNAQLLWFGMQYLGHTTAKNPSSSSYSSVGSGNSNTRSSINGYRRGTMDSAGLDPGGCSGVGSSRGSPFAERCWRQGLRSEPRLQAEQGHLQQHEYESTAVLIAAATAALEESCSQDKTLPVSSNAGSSCCHNLAGLSDHIGLKATPTSFLSSRPLARAAAATASGASSGSDAGSAASFAAVGSTATWTAASTASRAVEGPAAVFAAGTGAVADVRPAAAPAVIGPDCAAAPAGASSPVATVAFLPAAGTGCTSTEAVPAEPAASPAASGAVAAAAAGDGLPTAPPAAMSEGSRPKSRRVSGSCIPVAAAGGRGDDWAMGHWGGGGHAVAH